MGGQSLNLETLKGGGGGGRGLMQFRNSGGRGVKKTCSLSCGVVFSGITQRRCTCIYGNPFSPSITVYFSVGEKRRLETDLHLQDTRGCFL